MPFQPGQSLATRCFCRLAPCSPWSANIWGKNQEFHLFERNSAKKFFEFVILSSHAQDQQLRNVHDWTRGNGHNVFSIWRLGCMFKVPPVPIGTTHCSESPSSALPPARKRRRRVRWRLQAQWLVGFLPRIPQGAVWGRTASRKHGTQLLLGIPKYTTPKKFKVSGTNFYITRDSEVTEGGLFFLLLQQTGSRWLLFCLQSFYRRQDARIFPAGCPSPANKNINSMNIWAHPF